MRAFPKKALNTVVEEEGTPTIREKLVVDTSGQNARFWVKDNAPGSPGGAFIMRLTVAGAAGLEPATCGFGDRCSTN